MRSSTRAGVCAVLLCATACGGRVIGESDDPGGSGSGSGSGGAFGAGASSSMTGGGSTPPPRGAPGSSSGSVGTPGLSGGPVGGPAPSGSAGSGAGNVPGSGGFGNVPPDQGGTIIVGPPPPPPPKPVTLPPVIVSEPDSGTSSATENYVFAGMTNAGEVVAAFWNGGAEDVVTIDWKTGKSVSQGYLGDLHTWSNQITYDDRTRTAYAVGTNIASVNYIYSLELGNRGLVQASLDQANSYNVSYVLGGVTQDGHVVAAYWTGTQEAVVLLEPNSGKATYAGMLGDLYLWQDQLAYDDATRTVYAIGENTGNQPRVYALSLDTQKTTSVGLDAADGGRTDYVVGGMTKDHRFVAAVWGGSVENVVLLDPSTGQTSFVGNLGGLYWWSDQLVYGGANGTAVAYGMDVNSVGGFYGLAIGK